MLLDDAFTSHRGIGGDALKGYGQLSLFTRVNTPNDLKESRGRGE